MRESYPILAKYRLHIIKREVLNAYQISLNVVQASSLRPLSHPVRFYVNPLLSDPVKSCLLSDHVPYYSCTVIYMCSYK